MDYYSALFCGEMKLGENFRKTGIDIIGDVPWGEHFCQLYQTKEDLTDILVPYFKAGLKNNEFCMWVTSEPLKIEDAKEALERVIKDVDNYIEKGQIEILDASQWYLKSGKFEADKVLDGWVEKENQAIKRGFNGLRFTGDTFWLEKKDWRNFTAYEEKINKVIGKYRMIAICTYSLDRWGASEVIDVISNHQFTLFKRGSNWEVIEKSERRRTEEALKENGERFPGLTNHISSNLKIGIYGRQTKYWISRKIEEFFLNNNFEVITFPVGQYHEELVPTDFISFNKRLSKIFGFQYKALHLLNGGDFWKIDSEDHHRLSRYPWIYYCLSQSKSSFEHQSALYLIRIVNTNFEFKNKLYPTDEKALKGYSRWGGFYQELANCTKGALVSSLEHLNTTLRLDDKVQALKSLRELWIDVFLVDFASKHTLHISPQLR